MKYTDKQKEKIDLYKKQYEENVEEYDNFGIDDLCTFNVFASANEEDKNIVIVLSTISGVSETYEAIVQINNIMVEPDGNSFNLTDIYNREEVFGYIKNLIKIE